MKLLVDKVSVPPGGPFKVLLPAGGPFIFSPLVDKACVSAGGPFIFCHSWRFFAGSVTAVVLCHSWRFRLRWPTCILQLFFPMRHTCQPLYDHSYLHGVKPLREIWHTRERATLLVLRAVLLLLVLLQALDCCFWNWDHRCLEAQGQHIYLFWHLALSPETEIHAFFVTPSQYIRIFLFFLTQINVHLDQKMNSVEDLFASISKWIWFRLNVPRSFVPGRI